MILAPVYLFLYRSPPIFMESLDFELFHVVVQVLQELFGLIDGPSSICFLFSLCYCIPHVNG